MTSPLHDAASTPTSPPPAGLTPRQRLENALSHLAPSSTFGSQAQEAQAITRGELIAPIQRVNEVMRSYGVEFHLQEYGSRVVTRIVDRDSGDVIRQIPSEEVLRIAESLEQLRGRLLRHEA